MSPDASTLPQQRLPRHEVVWFTVIAVVAALLVSHGFLVADPPALFLIVSAVSGVAFGAIMLWGVRGKHEMVPPIVGGCITWFFGVSQRLFFERGADGTDLSWPVIGAQFGAFFLAIVPLFPALSRAKKAAQVASDRNGQA